MGWRTTPLTYRVRLVQQLCDVRQKKLLRLVSEGHTASHVAVRRKLPTLRQCNTMQCVSRNVCPASLASNTFFVGPKRQYWACSSFTNIRDSGICRCTIRSCANDRTWTSMFDIRGQSFVWSVQTQNMFAKTNELSQRHSQPVPEAGGAHMATQSRRICLSGADIVVPKGMKPVCTTSPMRCQRGMVVAPLSARVSS